MLNEQWDAFVIYVNTYYAVQEACDSARRDWEKPAEGLDAFCRDGNPFLWDAQSSAEEAIYEGFSKAFHERFAEPMCSAEDGYAFARDWLQSMEGGEYGTSLVEAFDKITDEREFADACMPVARQLHARASHIEMNPQDAPLPVQEIAPKTPSKADIEAVIAMLAHGDAAFAQSLRDRLAAEEG